VELAETSVISAARPVSARVETDYSPEIEARAISSSAVPSPLNLDFF
jgi:hypothetical protein